MKLPCVNEGGADSIVKLDRPAVIEQEMALPPEAVRALDFWSARPGAILTVVDSLGNAVRARLLEQGRIRPFQRLAGPPASVPCLTLYQALPEKERFELVLQKSVELGVGRIVPFVSERSTTLQARDAGQRKSHRWPEIILRAARQCRRPDIPELGPVMTFEQVLAETANRELSVMLYEGEAPWSLRDVAVRPGLAGAALIVGPEGGFSEGEIRRADAAGVLQVTLGQRILRTETAAIAGATLMQFVLGGLG